jgi:hypothetical protein
LSYDQKQYAISAANIAGNRARQPLSIFLAIPGFVPVASLLVETACTSAANNIAQSLASSRKGGVWKLVALDVLENERRPL